MERRERLRRNEDVDHARLEEKLGLLKLQVGEHIHEEVCTVLEGPLVKHTDGTVSRDEEKGLVHIATSSQSDIADIKATLNNGGIKTNLSAKSQIIVAVIAAIAVVASAVVGG